MRNMNEIIVLSLLIMTGIPQLSCRDKDKGENNTDDKSFESDTQSDTETSSTHQEPAFIDRASVYNSTIVLDANKNIYITGFTRDDSWVGPNEEPPLHNFGFCRTGLGSAAELFVMKLNPKGEYLWHTFYGYACFEDMDAHTLDTYGHGLRVDASGNVYVTGISRKGLSRQVWLGDDGTPPLQENTAHAYATYVLKLNSDGAYQWHTFYGGPDSSAWNVTMDLTSDGDVIVAGQVDASWLGPNDVEPLNEFSTGEGKRESIFVFKLDAEGTYQWHTFYGSSLKDHTGNVILDNEDNIYISGASFSPWQGDEGQEPLNAFSLGVNDEENIFVLKLNKDGMYQWHTFYGSDQRDYGGSLCIDQESNELIVVGLATNAWTGPEEQTPLNEEITKGAYILKMSSEGEYRWHTFFNGADAGTGNAVPVTTTQLVQCNVGTSGEIYISGASERSWHGPGGEPPLRPHNRTTASWSFDTDIFVMKYLENGTYQWHTFYGSHKTDRIYGSVAPDGMGNIFVCGDSELPWLGDGDAEPLNPHGGSSNTVIFVLDEEGNYQFHTFYGKSPADQ